MKTVGRYQDADAFRAALEQRIRTASDTTGVPHDRLRKDVAFQRLVARFVAVGDDRWVIKGGVGLLWRVGHEVRATRDIDANWQGNEADLEAFLDAAVTQEADDGFEFEIGAPRPLEGETEGALRFAVTARLAGREFTAFRLDVNFTAHARRIDTVTVHVPLLEFVGLADLQVPMISVAQQLAEKLHAVARTYASGDSSRIKDVYDSVLLTQTVSVPTANELTQAVEATFTLRATPLLEAPGDLPESWDEPLTAFLDGFAIPGVTDLAELRQTWRNLWQAILDRTATGDARWNPSTRSWT